MKKVILTEEQKQYLLTEEGLAQLLQETINESKSFDELKKKIKKALAMGVTVAAIVAAIQKLDIPDANKRELMNDAQQEQVDTTGFAKKVQDVENYMKFALKNHGVDEAQFRPSVPYGRCSSGKLFRRNTKSAKDKQRVLCRFV